MGTGTGAANKGAAGAAILTGFPLLPPLPRGAMIPAG